jgi:hypothetical protein
MGNGENANTIGPGERSSANGPVAPARGLSINNPLFETTPQRKK